MSVPRPTVLVATAAAATLLVAGASSAGAAAPAASPAATIWRGWVAPGPAGVGNPADVTAREGVTAVQGDAVDGVVPFLTDGPGGRRVGRTAPADGRLVSAGGRLLLQPDGCRVRRSADGGSTWTSAPLPGCGAGIGSAGDGVYLAVASDLSAWASAGLQTWRTTDGGLTWVRSKRADGSAVVARSGRDAIGFGYPNRLGGALTESRDGGDTWTQLGFRTSTRRGGFYINVSPDFTVPVLRGDGALVVGLGLNMAVQPADAPEPTFHEVPNPTDVPGPTEVETSAVVCDPGTSCVVGVQAQDGRRSALVFANDAFGATVAPLPDVATASPSPGVIVGLDGPTAGSSARRVVRTDDLGATPYRTIFSGAARPASVGTHGLLAVASDDRLHVSSDGGASWTDAPLPAAAPTTVARAGGTLVALTADGTVSRLVGGAWQRVADLSALAPRSLAVAGDAPVVVGDHGVVRLTDPAAPSPATDVAVRDRAFSGVTSSGDSLIAWNAKGVAARSTDGGASWTASTVPAGTDDVQLASSTVAYALAGRTLHRSTDGGRRFVRAAVAPSLGSAGPIGEARQVGLEFSSTKRGVLRTPAGPFVTGNGGRTLEFLAVPGAVTPPAAAVSGASIAAQDPVSGTVYRQPTLLNAPVTRLSLQTVGRVRHGRSGSRVQTVSGRLPGVGAGEPVALLGVARTGPATTLEAVVRTDARGRFRRSVRLARGQRGVQAWYRGIVRADRTIRGASSPVVAVKR